MNDERLGDDVLDAEAGIERGEGILEDDLHIAAQPPHFAGAGGEQVAAFEADAARSRLKEPQNQPSQRALARSRFAHQSESFASLNVERNIVHGANFTSGLSAKRRFAVRINLGQVADFDKRHRLSSDGQLLHSFQHQTETLLAGSVG
jgi:hypothetical protein